MSKSIEVTFKVNLADTASVQSLINVLSGALSASDKSIKPLPKPAMKVEEKEPKKPEPKEKESNESTTDLEFSDVQAAWVKKRSVEGAKDKARAKLQELGFKKLGDLKPENYQDFIDFVDSL